MEKYVQSDIKAKAVRSGTWLNGINGIAPIIVILMFSLVLAGIAIMNYCGSSCSLF